MPRSSISPNDPFYADCPVNGCKVTLTAHTELGGSLPASVINMLSTAAPLKILTAIDGIVGAAAAAAAAAKAENAIHSSQGVGVDTISHTSGASTSVSLPLHTQSLPSDDSLNDTTTTVPCPPSPKGDESAFFLRRKNGSQLLPSNIDEASSSLLSLSPEHQVQSLSEPLSPPPPPLPPSSSSPSITNNVTESVSAAAAAASSSSTSSITKDVTESVSPESYVEEGMNVASTSIALMKIYLGLGMEEQESKNILASMQLDWQQRTRTKTMNISTTMVKDSTWNAIRAITTMHSDIKQIVDLLIDDNRINEFDDMVDFIVPLVNVDARTAIRRIVCKPIWPTAPRDFIVCTTYTELEDGSVMVCSRSVTDEVFSQQKGYVRGFVNVSGYYIQRQSSLAENDPSYADCPVNGCKITLTAHTELGGFLPSSVINMLSTGAPLKILTAVDGIVSSKQK